MAEYLATRNRICGTSAVKICIFIQNDHNVVTAHTTVGRRVAGGCGRTGTVAAVVGSGDVRALGRAAKHRDVAARVLKIDRGIQLADCAVA